MQTLDFMVDWGCGEHALRKDDQRRKTRRFCSLYARARYLCPSPECNRLDAQRVTCGWARGSGGWRVLGRRRGLMVGWASFAPDDYVVRRPDSEHWRLRRRLMSTQKNITVDRRRRGAAAEKPDARCTTLAKVSVRSARCAASAAIR